MVEQENQPGESSMASKIRQISRDVQTQPSSLAMVLLTLIFVIPFILYFLRSTLVLNSGEKGDELWKSSQNAVLVG